MKAARRTRTDWTVVGQEIDMGNITVVVKKKWMFQTRRKEKFRRRRRPRCLRMRPIDFGVIIIVWSVEQED